MHGKRGYPDKGSYIYHVGGGADVKIIKVMAKNFKNGYQINELDYYKNRVTELEKKAEQGDSFFNGCLPLILLAGFFIGVLIFG